MLYLLLRLMGRDVGLVSRRGLERVCMSPIALADIFACTRGRRHELLPLSFGEMRWK